MQIAWRACRLTARMGFRQPHVPALFRHLLATLARGRRHFRTGQCARRDRLRDQHQRQSGNTEFDQQLQTSPVYLQLTIRRNRRRKVSPYLRHLVGQPNLHATAVTLVAPAKPVLPIRLNDLIVPICVETESAVYQPQNQRREAFSSGTTCIYVFPRFMLFYPERKRTVCRKVPGRIVRLAMRRAPNDTKFR
jgi:hypothetical protein